MVKIEWKPIEGYDGLYLISDTGKIFSAKSEKILKTYTNRLGYERIELNINGVAKKHLVHRLVAEAFIPNPDNLPIINHKDENPRNNSVDNLEWCTYQYNTNYGTCIERRVENTVYKHGEENPNSKKVYQFDMDGNLLAEYVSVREAARITGLSDRSISKACVGSLKKYAEYVWSHDGTFHYDKVKHYKPRFGAIRQYDLQGNLIAEYNTLDEIREAGFNPQHVNRVCRGERKTYMNFIFTR